MGVDMHPLKAIQMLRRGRSYWQVILTTGRIWSELDTINDPTRGKRPLDWHLDLVATGDVARIAELWLQSPAGPVALKITEPNSAWILNTNITSNIYGTETVAQTIGRVDDKETGLGVAFIWDASVQQMFKDEKACVRNFGAWRPGICAPGALNLTAVGLAL
jgi:hypothetical protein